ncbi:DinB family protein [Halalkalibacterium halodurans]|uniref:DinB family protein n=1 Tax=Halalkalibacterium halodurans TaxID=86665 RepID=UPI002E21A83B|nr:DinB family protein [Halalkalibacterium halodurans]MED4087166.1 DinB family protein [Halalkalibacterium halodurans]MED4107170.1 DinB family protein [Halalkalibacterium halodurans]MED4111159.1 DinB family protein [Halalkalibacterium halodurans]MED4123834.1 DinB family protein [Halalkalibacterium halodurans]
MNQRPSEEEYAGDVGEYIRLVPDGNIIDILLAQEKQLTELLASLTESHGAYRYAEGKWTLKEVGGHIVDGERVMTYRLLRFARGDQTPLSGFDQELFIPPFGSWTTAQLAEDYRSVRQSTITLLRGLPAEAWSRKGTANNASITVRALAYGIAGHEIHHMGVIRNRYLS